MKKLLYILLFVFSFANGFSQEDSMKMPTKNFLNSKFEGATDNAKNYVVTEIVYPQKAKENGIMGKPLFGFLVDSSGTINSVDVLVSSGSKDLDNEGIRAIFSMPKWKPKNNIPVYFTLAITFILGPMSPNEEKAYHLKWKNKHLDYFIKKGSEKVNENKLDDALNLFNRGLDQSPDDVDFLYNKAVVLIKMKNTDEACKTLSKIKTLNRHDGDELIRKYCPNIVLALLPPVDTNEVYTIVEKMPAYPGGLDKLNEFVNQNTNFELTKKESEYQNNKVFVKFIISTNGSIKDPQILRGSGNKIIDGEVLRVVNLIKGWAPGEQNGVKVPVYFNLPVKVI